VHPTILYATLLAGQYTTPVIYAEVTAVFTNTAPVDAYRGAGRPEATYVVERLVETAAREMKMNPAEIRRRNFIKAFPYQTPVALLYDTGNYEATLGEALNIADVAGFPARKAEAAKRGKLRGLGYACYIEACGYRALERRRRPGRARGPVRGGRGPRASHRQGNGVHRLALPRPGTRDDFRASRGRPARDSDRRRGHRPRRHVQDPLRHGGGGGGGGGGAPTARARSRSAAPPS